MTTHKTAPAIWGLLQTLALFICGGFSASSSFAALVTMTNWTQRLGGNGHFYEAVATSGIVWSNASLAATNRGGYLATITSAQENQLVFELIRDNTNLWVIRPSTDSWGPWIGGVQPPGSPEPAGGWSWLTGEPFAYQHWNAGEPNNSGGAEDRIIFLGNKAPFGDVWNDTSAANSTIRSYVVEYEQNLEPAPIVELLFNETGTNAADTGSSFNKALFTDANGAIADLHSGKGLGVSGVPEDRAFDNSTSTGMGSNGSGGHALQAYDDSVDGLLSLTLQGWFKADSAIGSLARVFAKQAGNTGFLLLATSSGALSLEINNVASTISSGKYSEVGQWVFFAVSYDGTATSNNVKFYKGSLANPVTLLETRSLNQGRAVTNSSGVSYANANGLQRPLDAFVDNFRIFGSKTDGRGALTTPQLEWFRNKDIQSVTDVPVISISSTNGGLTISWATYPGGFHLEQSVDLSTEDSWQPVTTTPALVNGQNTLTLPRSESFEAFRLAR